MKKIFISVLIIVILLVVGYLVFGNSTESDSDSLASVSDTIQISPDDPTDVTITFTDDGYSPTDISVSTGDIVEWVNESSTAMWPASNLHPTHDTYPASGGCIGSAFDSCGEIPVGESWRFKFTEEGEWDFHDHLAPLYNGTVTVE